MLAFQFSFAQNTLPVGSLQITNDGMFNTNINSENVSRIDMGFDGSKGFINFGAHTGDGYRNNIFYMRGSDGHIGLGTSTPRAVLDVSYHIGNGVLGAVFGRLSEGDNNGDGTFLGVRGYNTSVVNGKSFSIEHSFYGITNSSINFFRGGSTTGGGISFNTNANEEQMRINANGNVGIGEINPQNKLDVNGTIHSKEVKVDMNGWSDFVFKKEYSLVTLEQVEKHIAEKGHLENIPNEEEVLKVLVK
ncbi:hypothetical protein JI750_05880 [Flavobacterium sp. GN10]|uniref:Peptidase S74 domain-containing protein n=1 Tax=Flavobacterium tagetis TaxID=2801336 RepID=A0ABS1KA67_9FLAO|nr:hypothetical protein [Flavobacterium tagetis]MBL0736405.1 hypothetical protein [Flavobacterium tagetis]